METYREKLSQKPGQTVSEAYQETMNRLEKSVKKQLTGKRNLAIEKLASIEMIDGEPFCTIQASFEEKTASHQPTQQTTTKKKSYEPYNSNSEEARDAQREYRIMRERVYEQAAEHGVNREEVCKWEDWMYG